MERPCQPLKIEDVAARVAMTMLILVNVVARCGGDHYRARIWTVVGGVISGGQPTFGLIYQYLLGLWRCAWAALCWKQVSARRLTFRSPICRALVERAAENKILTWCACLRAYRVRLMCSVSRKIGPRGVFVSSLSRGRVHRLVKEYSFDDNHSVDVRDY